MSAGESGETSRVICEALSSSYLSRSEEGAVDDEAEDDDVVNIDSMIPTLNCER